MILNLRPGHLLTTVRPLTRDALRHWRFQPATVDGRALAVYQIVRVPFRLENL